jgi:hypothetical protein
MRDKKALCVFIDVLRNQLLKTKRPSKGMVYSLVSKN